MAANGPVRLRAPLSGILVPIEHVPDPVFSRKMVGDGISIDPTSSELLAPCDGSIIQFHHAHHALTIRSPEGIEVMLHVGLDTVELKGDGFTALVAEGDAVSAGDPLLRFDADFVATHARSLLTQVVITNGERVASLTPGVGLIVAGDEGFLDITLADVDEAAVAATDAETVTSEVITVPNPTGLHARPAAVLAGIAKTFDATISLRKGTAQASACSVVGIMGLNVVLGDELQVEAQGPDAVAAVERLSSELLAGLGDDLDRVAEPPAAPAVSRPIRSDDPRRLTGIIASPGLAIGQVLALHRDDLDVPIDAKGAPDDERQMLATAIRRATLQLAELERELAARGSGARAAIFVAHRELLEDPALDKAAADAMGEGRSAAFAWREAVEAAAEQLEALGNPLLAERAGDLRDVGRRVLSQLLGKAPKVTIYPQNCILMADDLTPSDTVNLDPARVKGFCTRAGGATSHVAILARSLGIPALAGIDARALELADGTTVILDADAGVLAVEPSAEMLAEVAARQARITEKQQRDRDRARESATTRDGTRIEVVANIGSADDARSAVEHGAEGVGLLRTEFLFLDRTSAPDENEQSAIYGEIAATMGAERPVIVRTLDVGGDKPLAYLPAEPEENPFLGERGIRIGLAQPELFRVQLRAILRASTRGRLRIMFPMVATLEELREARALLEEERVALGVEPIEVGIMIEVPSTAIMADQFAREVDFFSVGTNDLTQYALAMDRGHPRLAPRCDPLHPAVLRLINLTVQGGRRHGVWTGVCGGIASDPRAVPILVGLGVTELSASVLAIPAIKARVRECSMDGCKALAKRALAAGTAAEVRALVSDDEGA